MASAKDKLRSAQNQQRPHILPKREVAPPTKTVLADEAEIIKEEPAKPEIKVEIKAEEKAPEIEVKVEPKKVAVDVPVKKEQSPKKSTPTKDKMVVTERKSINEGTSHISVKFADRTDQVFFNSISVIKGFNKWQLLEYLINNDAGFDFNRDDELHTEIRNMSNYTMIVGTLPITPEGKEKLVTQSALHGFKSIGSYVAYLVKKERLQTPGWN